MQEPLPPIPAVATIDEVVAAIDGIIDWSITNTSHLGYFAALYKRITVAIRQGIIDGKFQDGPRMERFDVTFASRYFAALNAYFHPLQFPPLSLCWRVAFEGALLPEPIIVQHLLAGVNAHIDLDLGIAAEETAPGPALPSLHDDFNAVNVVLASQVMAVLDEIDELSPVLADLYDVFMKYEIDIINTALEVTRDDAWAFASLLAVSPKLVQPFEIAKHDVKVTLIGRLILAPPKPLSDIVAAIAARESRDVVHNITVLNAQAEAFAAAIQG